MVESLRSVLQLRPIQLNPAERRLRKAANIDDLRTIARRRLPLPLVLAPTGFTRVASPGGELDAARAAARMKIPFTLSTMATRAIEEVAAVCDGPKWFQIYVWRDRGLVKDLLSRAASAGCEAIVITVDTALLGRRQRDVRRDSRAVNLAEYINAQFDQALSWRDLDWFRANWDGPIVLKGIQTVGDAVLAADAAVDAIALSNHGGRQLDGAPAILELVRPVADAVGDRVEIICDGGIRRGSDILKAVALGARACMTGRAFLYGLGAAGQRGAEHALALLSAELRRTMALTGQRCMSDLTPDLIAWRDTLTEPC